MQYVDIIIHAVRAGIVSFIFWRWAFNLQNWRCVGNEDPMNIIEPYVTWY